ncbi:MAG: c-type cytochrome [Gemmatimonadota bacterium]
MLPRFRARSRIRRTATALAAVVLGALAVPAVVYLRSEQLLTRRHDAPLVPLAPGPPDSLALAQGRRFVTLAGCRDCHGDNLAGRFRRGLWAPNLTGGGYTDAELARAIRYGVKRDGTAIFGMPAGSYYHLADNDLAAIITFLRSLAPIRSAEPGRRPGFAARVSLVLGRAPWRTDADDLEERRAQSTAITARPTLGYGAYLAQVFCTQCHGQDLAGQGAGNDRVASLAVVADYTEREFAEVFASGRAQGGRALRPGMPWQRFSLFSSTERQALYLYLSRLGRQGVLASR